MSSILLPGFGERADDEQARRSREVRLARLPVSVPHLAGDIQVITDVDAARQFADALPGLSVSLIGVDTEFRFNHPKIILGKNKEFTDPSKIEPLVCSIAVLLNAGNMPDDRRGVLIRGVFDLRNRELWPHLQRVFDLPVSWVAHAAKAEYHALWACGIRPAEDRLVDSFLAACALTSGEFHRRNVQHGGADADHREQQAHVRSLIGQCQRYALSYPFVGHKDRLRQQFLALGPDDELTAEMIDYAVADAEFAVRVHRAQMNDLADNDLLRHLMTVEYPLVGAIARMELNGLPVDTTVIATLDGPLAQIASEYAEELQRYGITPNSRDSFLAKMEAAGLSDHFIEAGKSTTNKDVLRRALENDIHPAVKPFYKYRNYVRMRGDLIQIQRIRGSDGRVRCTLDQIEATSGRFASRKPNLIGLPAVLRVIIKVEAGRVLAELDFSQIEVFVAGALWGDEELLQLCAKGDAYAAVAQRLYADQLTPQEKQMSALEFKDRRSDLRKITKAILLGLLYGKGVDSLARDLKCSVAEAEQHLERFFQAFPKAKEGGVSAIEHGLQRSYATSISGFKRFIKNGGRQQENALRNHPIQCSAMTIFKKALAKVDREYRDTEVRLLLPRHDSILIECPCEMKDDVITRVKALMIEAAKEVFPSMQARVSAESGQHWPTDRTLEKELESLRGKRKEAQQNE